MRKAALVLADELLRQELLRQTRCASTQQRFVLRSRIILAAMQGLNNREIAHQLQINISSVAKWRGRWAEVQTVPLSELSVVARLRDAPRSGTPATISAEAYCQILVIACQPPENFGRPITHWTARELADQATDQGIVPRISPRQVGRFLKRSRPEAALEPLLAHQPRRPGQRPKDRRGLPTL